MSKWAITKAAHTRVLCTALDSITHKHLIHHLMSLFTPFYSFVFYSVTDKKFSELSKYTLGTSQSVN